MQVNQSWSGDGTPYLEFYYHCAIRTLSNRFDNGFWSRTVLQMARAEPAIQQALIALGYLAKTEPGNLRHAHARLNMPDKILNRHYSKSVSFLVQRMSEKSCTVEVGLVACLLFVCIEFFKGNFLQAFSHLHGGLKIISELPSIRAHGMYISSKDLQVPMLHQDCVRVHRHHVHQQMAQSNPAIRYRQVVFSKIL